MKTRIEILILVITVLSFYGCEKKTSTEPLPVANTTYIPLNTGDVRQVVNPADSSTILMRIVGILKRKDGVEVFAEEWTYGVGNPDTLYCMIKDGFFMSTELDSSANPINPFGEQRLGKVNPVNGETWIHTLGDPDTMYFTATYYKELHTLCGTFTNVYGFTLTANINIDTTLIVFYAENIGYIGTDWYDNRNPNVRASYLKVANHEYGTLLPSKNGISLLPKINNSNRLGFQFAAMFSFLGVQTPANQALKLTK